MVTPSQRRRGVGRALLAAAVHLADELGVEHVLATAAAGSREGNRYLARLGFAPLVMHRVAPTSVLRALARHGRRRRPDGGAAPRPDRAGATRGFRLPRGRPRRLSVPAPSVSDGWS